MFLSVALWNILFCNALSYESNRSVYIKAIKSMPASILGGILILQ